MHPHPLLPSSHPHTSHLPIPPTSHHTHTSITPTLHTHTSLHAHPSFSHHPLIIPHHTHTTTTTFLPSFPTLHLTPPKTTTTYSPHSPPHSSHIIPSPSTPHFLHHSSLVFCGRFIITRFINFLFTSVHIP
ncbi:hypothetical protein Pcinc_018081 [Petrolisthes cinctipes]|uniref:Uncharacterized protein n=1 Tax=Petrolisthes cinctipes TaxID=88211 RepID=A0AAE1KP72_PETCI|nr:hypothetical protein Pcinc_018081 [Petrolisthes cinctipes]